MPAQVAVYQFDEDAKKSNILWKMMYIMGILLRGNDGKS
jgi:hypothetical protein